MVGRSPNLALRLASATCPLKPACSCSFAADTFARPCSSVCSRDAMDQGSGARRRETPRLPVQDGCWTRWTSGAFVDAGRLTHNPEVAGSNPAPATSFRRSRPFPIRERAFCVPGAVAKRVAATVLHAALQGDRGDGVTRDETAWTWWTLPPATAGRLAQKYRRCTGVRAGPARTHSRRIEAWRRCYVLTPSANTVRALSRTYRRFSAVNSRGREAGDRAQISLFGVRMQDSFSEVHLNGPVASRPPERR
jgi:hypothetical protein